MDVELTISVDTPPLPSGKLLFPHLAYAVEQVAAAAHAKWIGYAQGAPLPDGKPIKARSGAYLKSIKIEQTGPLRWSIFSDAPYASAIEYGTQPYDMKKALATSPRVRRTKDGTRYLIIPFRWGTAGTATFGRNTMNAPEHALAKQLAPSHITGTGTRPSGNYPGQTVPQHGYHWGGRLSHGDLKQAGLRGLTFAQAKRARNLIGMVKFQQPDSSKHSQYLTFRVMSEKSNGWIRPAVPGRYPLRSAVRAIKPEAEKVFQAALQKDVDAIMGGRR